MNNHRRTPHCCICLVAAALLFCCASTVSAHPEGFSGLRLVLRDDGIHAILTLHTRDMSRWFPPTKYPNYVADVSKKLAADGPSLLEIQLDDVAATSIAVRTSSPEVGMLEIDLDYPPPAASAKTITVWSKHLPNLPRGHQQLLFIGDARGGLDDAHARSLLDAVLSTQEDSATVDLPPPPTGHSLTTTSPTTTAAPTTAAVAASASPTAPAAPHRGISFFWLGVEHIVTGYDHLLFLAALLLVCKNFREAAGVITFFTIAHSITLTLAALDLVRIPGRIVEPAIAASIVYVGLENIFGRHRFVWRAGITFAFGLVHGLGFASALREVGLGSTSVGIAWPLLKFSVGLETGQLTIAAVVLTILLALRRRWPEDFANRVAPAGSVVVAAIGGFWLVSRILAG